jgi:hypothetical protein
MSAISFCDGLIEGVASRALQGLVPERRQGLTQRHGQIMERLLRGRVRRISRVTGQLERI